MKTTHTLSTTRYQSGTVNGMDYDAETPVDVTYTVNWGAPAQGPSYASGGQPADPDEVELVSAKAAVLQGDAFDDLRQKDLDDWATEWLADEGFAEAIKNAEDDREDR